MFFIKRVLMGSFLSLYKKNIFLMYKKITVKRIYLSENEQNFWLFGNYRLMTLIIGGITICISNYL